MKRIELCGWYSKIYRLVVLILINLIFNFSIAVSAIEMPKERLKISSSFDKENKIQISKGEYYVHENREQKKGKVIKLEFVILHAIDKNPSPYPLFLLAGGPGVSAIIYESRMKNADVLKTRDIVLVALRGTGGDNRLHCDLTGGRGAQGYFDSVFDLEMLKSCRDHLSAQFDLTKYSNPAAVDDLDELREALGYKKINLMGFSGVTRVALVYMKRHPGSIRAAILNGVVSYEFKNPLYHASASQASLGKLFAEYRENPESTKAYPDFEKEFYSILARLQKKPVQVTITDPKTKTPVEVIMDRNDFAEAVRFMLYSLSSNRKIPYLLHRAYEGHYEPFAQLTADNAMGLNRMLSMGLLLCVTCAEDVDRITEEEIVSETKGTFLGDTRVREQKAACAIWPRSKISPDYESPLKTNIPVLLLSGTIDPVTPPKFAETLHHQLANSFHLIVPGVHGVVGACLKDIQEKFLETASFENLDISCTKNIKLPPIFIPQESGKEER